MPLGRRIIVPVANPASVGPLLALATALCDADGEVVPLTVLPHAPEPGELAAAEHGLTQAEAAVRSRGGRARGEIVHAERTTDGVLSAIREHDASLVVMGWRGRSSTSTVFGELIDSVVGRSSAPLAVVRLGEHAHRRVLVPVSPDHLLPAGRRGLRLATDLAARLARVADEPTTVLRTGRAETALPADVLALGDRVHHDPRRTHLAVGAAARPEDAIVAPVAPTVSGLRAATTHLAWAAPEATLVVAVDPGPTEKGIVEAVGAAGAPAPRRPERPSARVSIAVTATSVAELAPADLERVLASAGSGQRVSVDVEPPQATTRAPEGRCEVRALVHLRAPSTNLAMALVMEAVHEAPELRGAEITYDLQGSEADVEVVERDVTVHTVPPGELEVLHGRPEPEDRVGRAPGPRSLR